MRSATKIGLFGLLIFIILACITATSYGGAYENEDIILSTSRTATLGGLRFRDGDLVKYNPTNWTASLYSDFSENLFSRNEDIDAVDILANGHILLSTDHSATLGGLSFKDGDLVEYDLGADKATLFFSERLFSCNEDIDAVDILPNGHILLSTEHSARLGGLRFKDGDLVEYDPNPNAKTARLFFSEGLFSHNEDIDAVDVLPDGSIILSTRGPAKLGGLRFGKNDLVRYFPYDPLTDNPMAGRATLYLSGGYFSSGRTNIDAVCVVPEPTTILLLGLGSLALLRKRRA